MHREEKMLVSFGPLDLCPFVRSSSDISLFLFFSRHVLLPVSSPPSSVLPFSLPSPLFFLFRVSPLLSPSRSRIIRAMRPFWRSNYRCYALVGPQAVHEADARRATRTPEGVQSPHRNQWMDAPPSVRPFVLLVVSLLSI